MGRLDGKVAIITGAARGQGEAAARLFSNEGAKVVVTDVLDKEGEAVAKDIGKSVIFAHLDVSQEDNWQEVVDVTVEKFGPPTVLLNNAAVLIPKLIMKTSVQDYMKVISINQIGVFLGMKAVYEHMKAAGNGSIINTSSIDGLKSANGLISYSASKFAIRGMTKTAAIEWGHDGIRVNSLHPGGINTMMGNPRQQKEVETAPYKLQPIPRIGAAIEVANAALFLASDEASFITGTELSVDGGWRAGLIIKGLPGPEAAKIDTNSGYNN